MLPGQRRQRHDPSRSFPVDLRCQHGSTRFTQVGLPFPVLQGSPRWFLTCQKPPERPPVHPGPSGIIPVHHGGTTVQPPVLPGSPRSMDRDVPGENYVFLPKNLDGRPSRPSRLGSTPGHPGSWTGVNRGVPGAYWD